MRTARYHQVPGAEEPQPNKHFVFHIPVSESVSDLFHSEHYMQLVFESLGPADFYDTYILRYPGVVMTCLKKSFDVGPTIQFMCEHPALSIAYTIGIIALCILGFDKAYQKQIKANQKKIMNYSLLMKWFMEDDPYLFDPSELIGLSPVQLHNKNYREKVRLFNRELDHLRAEDPKLNKLYEDFKIEIPNEDPPTKLNFKDLQFRIVARNDQQLEKEALKKAQTQAERDALAVDDSQLSYAARIHKKILKPIWNKVLVPAWQKTNILRNTLFIAAFIYWIEFITASLFNGGILNVGVVGLPPVIAFGLPLLVALPYAAIATYHYIKNREWTKSREEIEKEKAAKLNSMDVIAAVTLRLELKKLENERRHLKAELLTYGMHQPTENFKIQRSNLYGILPGGRWAKLKAASTFFTSTQSEEGISQYIAWYLTDFLQIALNISMIIPMVNTVVGAIFLGLSVFYGVVALVKRYHEVQAEKADNKGKPANQPAISMEVLEAELAARNQELASLSQDIMTLRSEINSNITNDPYLKNENKVSEPSCVIRARHALQPDEPPTGFLGKARDFLDKNMCGHFFGRLFFVAGSAIVLAFMVTTFGIGSIVAVAVLGLLYATAKYVEEKQKYTVSHTNELIANIREREKEIQLAKMTKQNLEMKKDLLLRKAAKAKASFEANHKLNNKPTSLANAANVPHAKVEQTMPRAESLPFLKRDLSTSSTLSNISSDSNSSPTKDSPTKVNPVLRADNFEQDSFRSEARLITVNA